MSNQDIVRILEEEIKSSGITIEELAKTTDIELSKLENILNNKEDIDIDELTNIIDCINPTIKRVTEILTLYNEEKHKEEQKI